jgi:mRNA interferase RelE/StbE
VSSNNPNWRIVISRGAERELRRLSASNQRRVVAALDGLVEFPQQGDIRKLRGRNEWRLRVGEVRIQFTPDSNNHVIVIRHILPRGSAYRQ